MIGADARLGEEGGDARPAGADALGQRPLRVEFQLELAGQVELGEQLVLADVGRDHLPHLARLQEKPEARSVHAGVVGDEGEVLRARVADGADQRVGNAAQPEAAGHDRHPVLDEAGQRRPCVRINLVHPASLTRRGVTLAKACPACLGPAAARLARRP
jgi:hypothetical protein